MKQRLGALLCVALGAVLITTGFDTGSGANVGGVVPDVPDCGTPVGVAVACPTGTIAITKTTVIPAGSTVTAPPGGFKVDITSTCLDPGKSLPVSQTVSVPANGTGTSTELFVYRNDTHTTKCSYVLHEEPVAGFTGVFNPVSPVQLPFGGGTTNLAVQLTNTAAAPSSPASTSATPTVITDSGLAPSSSAAPLAATGPREQVRTSVYIGIALCLLGVALFVAGSVSRRRGRHAG